MKTRHTLHLLALAGLLALTGCSSTFIKDSSVQKRTVSLTLPLGISFEKTTEGLVIGEAELIKKEETE